MKFGPLPLLLAFLLACPITACVWVKGTTKNATHTTMGRHPLFHLRAQLQRSMELDLREEGAQMEEALRGKTGLDERNDYSVALMFLGRPSEAVTLLEQLEAEKPGEYATAANLGTAYELAGRNQDAKRWIDEAIRRDPDSHDGTEWLHAEILTAKIQQDRDPLYFRNHAVLNIDYRTLTTGAEMVQIHGRQLTVKTLVRALEYQLTERLKFVKGPDPVVASLLFDFAALEAGTGTLETASGLLKMASEYGYPSERIDPLAQRYAATIKLAGLRTDLFVTGGSLAFVALLLFAYKRKWLVLRRVVNQPVQ